MNNIPTILIVAIGAIMLLGDLSPRNSLAGDWNGDGVGDLTWRNYSTGANYIWFIGDTISNEFDPERMTVLGGASFPAAGDTEWHIEGTSDFDKDGQEDILWRHQTTGANYIWLMSSPALLNIGYQVSGGIGIPQVADTNWKIEALGDFNRDGTKDIVWRHYPSGSNYVWYLSGTLGSVTVSGGTALPSVTDSNWKIRGAGDFDQNNTPDILWRNYVWGHNYIWYMTYTTGNSLLPIGGDFMPTLPLADNEIIGVSDFNLDGLPDILWGRDGTGENMTIQGVGCCPPEIPWWAYLPWVSDTNWKPTAD